MFVCHPKSFSSTRLLVDCSLSHRKACMLSFAIISFNYDVYAALLGGQHANEGGFEKSKYDMHKFEEQFYF